MHTDFPYILGALTNGECVPLLQADRRRHVYIVGQTGTGKTGLLLNLMHADLRAGAGFCFLDPHGDASKELLR
jgi:DNA helicase HerA-like ATPase